MAITEAIPVWTTLLALAALVAVVIWANQREINFQASEARADLAESRAATAEAVVTVQAHTQAATATALAYTSSPEASIDRSLGLVLAAERDPTDQRLKALMDAFGAPALSVLRPEIEHLLSGGLHLGGASGYEISVSSTTPSGPDQVQTRTRERWTYDERNADDQRTRCLVESSEQTYTLQRAGAEWQVTDIQIGASSRADCPQAP
jgi:hypothetical protein